jgi:uncharacterized oligopeptide transporter (OPT) family protein
MSMAVVLFGSLGLVLVLMLIPQMGLGISIFGFLAAVLILIFGFLFVTVSSRLTGEVGSSSNPISGMTIATLLLTCIIFYAVNQRDHAAMLTALTVAAVVCIASSNGGTTSQDLKTGFLVGATPRYQQLAITVGAVTSALVIGGTMLALNAAGTHYTKRGFPENQKLVVNDDAPREHVGRPYEDKDPAEYRVVHVLREDKDKYPGVKPGRYLVDAGGVIRYKTDIPIAQEFEKTDFNEDAPRAFAAPQPDLFRSIIDGILGGRLEWTLFIAGVMIAIAMEFAGVRALPFAVGMYIPLSSTTPIFIGGVLRWLTDRIRGVGASEAETETSPGVLLASGFIAGGTLTGLIIAFFNFSETLVKRLNSSNWYMPDGETPIFPLDYSAEGAVGPKVVALIMFALLVAALIYVGARKLSPETEPEHERSHTV